jgi:hypothetical protein
MSLKIKDEGLNCSKVMETAFTPTDVSGPRWLVRGAVCANE